MTTQRKLEPSFYRAAGRRKCTPCPFYDSEVSGRKGVILVSQGEPNAPNKNMLAEERRGLILEILNAKETVRVSDLSAHFSVTEETIRRDLDELARKKLLKRTHGGAIKGMGTGFEMPYLRRRAEKEAEKRMIARAAVKLIGDGDTIIMDGSSTVLYLCDEIRKLEQVTILTNSLQVVTELSGVRNHHVIATGGSVRRGSHSFAGPVAERTIEEHNVDFAFISCRGVSLQKGITDYNDLLVEIKKRMIAAAQQVVLLVDHSKFDAVGFVRVGPIDLIDVLITDNAARDETLARFINAGIQVIVADGA